MVFDILAGTYSVVRLGAADRLPEWACSAAEFTSITRTADELSIVCDEGLIPQDSVAERGWNALKVKGPLDFSMVGVLADVSRILAAANISMFAVSTYDTDYILVKSERLAASLEALRSAGHDCREPHHTRGNVSAQ